MAEQERTRNFDLEYDPIKNEEVLDIHHYFSDLFYKFLGEMKFPEDTNYFINSYALMDAIIRVDKRKAYFYCFHNMTINENKETALYAYWIVKLRPFVIVDNRFNDDKKSSYINELFAAYLIYCILLFDNDDFNNVEFIREKSDKFTYHDKIMYSLHYRCFTIDSIMLLVDSITPQTFEIEYDVES